MKKLVLVLLLVVLCAGVAYALPDQDPNRRVSMYVKSNTTAGAGATDVVSTNTINGNDLILGYTITNDSTYPAAVGLYDTTAVGTCTTSTLFAEAETINSGASITMWFPYAKALSKSGQLTILLGDTKATVIIYYEDR